MFTPKDKAPDPKDPWVPPFHPAPNRPEMGQPEVPAELIVIIPTTDADFTTDLEVDFVPTLTDSDFSKAA